MSNKFRFLLIDEDGDVCGTNDAYLSGRAAEDGATVVIDLETCTYTLNDMRAPIEDADPDNWPEPEVDDEDDEAEED